MPQPHILPTTSLITSRVRLTLVPRPPGKQCHRVWQTKKTLFKSIWEVSFRTLPFPKSPDTPPKRARRQRVFLRYNGSYLAAMARLKEGAKSELKRDLAVCFADPFLQEPSRPASFPTLSILVSHRLQRILQTCRCCSHIRKMMVVSRLKPQQFWVQLMTSLRIHRKTTNFDQATFPRHLNLFFWWESGMYWYATYSWRKTRDLSTVIDLESAASSPDTTESSIVS